MAYSVVVQSLPKSAGGSGAEVIEEQLPWSKINVRFIVRLVIRNV